MLQKYFSENRSFYEIVWKQPLSRKAKNNNKVQRMCYAYCKPMATKHAPNI